MKKILFVAMQNSTHAARWINQLDRSLWDIHLFPVHDAPVHPDIKNVTVHMPKSWLDFPKLKLWLKYVIVRSRDETSIAFKRLRGINVKSPYKRASVKNARVRYVNPLAGSLSRFVSFGVKTEKLGTSDFNVSSNFSPGVLARVIDKIAPDIVHSMELQHAGYLTLFARNTLNKPKFPHWLISNWGSDIYYYKDIAAHRTVLVELLESADFYSCECHRDISLATELGFHGIVMPVIPNAGGFDLSLVGSLRTNLRPSKRKVVLVKGYQSFAGRALTAIDAIEMIANELNGYKVVVYSATNETREKVNVLKQTSSLDIEIVDHITHQDMLKLFSIARVYIGISVSDGISTSMLESIALGCFPIQTNTACCTEWIEDGVTGFIVRPDDAVMISHSLHVALSDDSLVDEASNKNWITVRDRLDKNQLAKVAVEYYKTMLSRKI